MNLSGDRPLFNRKYLIALLWILPLIIFYLQTKPFSVSRYQQLSRLGPDLIWDQRRDDAPHQFGLIYAVGAGIGDERRSEQRLLERGLTARLSSAELQTFLATTEWNYRLITTSSYSAAVFDADRTPTEAQIQKLLELLAAPPLLDWSSLLAELNAIDYIERGKDHGRLFRALTGGAEISLDASDYPRLLQQFRGIVLLTDEPPVEHRLHGLTNITTAAQRLALPGDEQQIYARGSSNRIASAWEFAPIQQSETLIVQQLIASVAALRLSRVEGCDWRFLPSGTIGIATLSTPDQASFNQALALLKTPLQPEELQQASEQLIDRWKQQADLSPLEWPSILQLYGTEPMDLQQQTAILMNQRRAELDAAWRVLQTSPVRRVNLISRDTR